MPERDYSHRSLIDKLGVSAGQRIAAVNVRNEPFLSLLAEACGADVSTSPRGMYDRIFLQIDTSRDLAWIAKLRKHLRADGAIWILHPKGRNAAVKDAEVRAVYLACGLVDNKVSAYTDAHTATRCVIPVHLRS